MWYLASVVTELVCCKILPSGQLNTLWFLLYERSALVFFCLLLVARILLLKDYLYPVVSSPPPFFCLGLFFLSGILVQIFSYDWQFFLFIDRASQCTCFYLINELINHIMMHVVMFFSQILSSLG